MDRDKNISVDSDSYNSDSNNREREYIETYYRQNKPAVQAAGAEPSRCNFTAVNVEPVERYLTHSGFRMP